MDRECPHVLPLHMIMCEHMIAEFAVRVVRTPQRGWECGSMLAIDWWGVGSTSTTTRQQANRYYCTIHEVWFYESYYKKSKKKKANMMTLC